MKKCSSTKSAHIVCKPCACKHSSKLANTVLATVLRTYIHPLKPKHTLQAVYMHPPAQACAYSASCVHSDPACKFACKSACELSMQSLHVQAEKGRVQAKFACTGPIRFS